MSRFIELNCIEQVLDGFNYIEKNIFTSINVDKIVQIKEMVGDPNHCIIDLDNNKTLKVIGTREETIKKLYE